MVHGDAAGRRGNDTIYGRGGWDTIYGGAGEDIIYGGAGSDRIVGGTGDDTLTGGSGRDIFYFWEDHGTDTITDFNVANDTIYLKKFAASITFEQLQAAMTDVADDPLTSEVNETAVVIDLSAWGGGTITLEGVTSAELTADNFVLDRLHGEDDSDDRIKGGTSDDTMTGGTGADTFVFRADSGDDTITDFTAGTDKIDLSAIVSITGLDDLSYCRSGDDVVLDLSDHGGGTITLTGVSTSDLSSSDFIFYQNTYTGTESAETLAGGAGDDTITGLGGDDTLTGNEGADTFVFASGHGSDTITDFTDGEDAIDLSAFTSITGVDGLTVTQSGNDTVITIPGGGTITLQDFTSTDLTDEDFVFHDSTMDGQQDGM